LVKQLVKTGPMGLYRSPGFARYSFTKIMIVKVFAINSNKTIAAFGGFRINLVYPCS